MVTYPNDWKEDKVSSVVDISTGCRDTQDNKANGRYPFFVRSPIVERIDIADYDCEAVLTAGDGVGTGKVFHYYNGRFAAHQRVYVMNNFRDVDGKYFYYFFSKNFIKEVEKYTAKSSVDSVRRAMIADMEFTHPQLPEQQDIVRVLTAFDSYIADLAELIEKKRGIRDGALEDLISGRTRLEGFEETWSEKKLRDLCTLITKQTGFDYSNEIKASLMEYRTTNSLPFIQNKDFEGFTINFQTDFYIPCDIAIKYPKIVLDEECLLISISGRIGNVAVFNNKETAFAGGAVGVAKLIDPALATWCMLYISSSLGQEQIFANEKVGAQHNLTVEDVRNLIIKLPKSEEREAIVATIKSMDEEIKALEIEREKMIQIREGAMDDLLTGRVRLSV